MAYIRKRQDSYKVEIRKKGHPHINRSFIDLKTARKFARDIESQMERNVFEDYSEANGTTLKDILIKYRDERTILKKGVREETGTDNFFFTIKLSKLWAFSQIYS
jgi:hypothetical protein